MVAERSYEKITQRDLARLSELAAADRADRFTRRPRWRVYESRIIAVALCQGAALHYVNGANGIKDFDVWTFYADHAEGPFPYRWTTRADFGPSRFGRRDSEPYKETYDGRRVDFIGRSLPEPEGVDAVAALTRYLSQPQTGSARCLAEKAIVVIDPRELRGQVLWPEAAYARLTTAGNSARSN
jgi:hypothetical protein